MNTWQAIRLLRSQRPGLAADDDERAAVFQAALEQAEQLMSASANLGHAARPLPLFYALSQAGRAIAAAHVEGDAWRIGSHGLSEVRAAADPRLAHRRLRIAPVLKDDRRDAFGAVAEATGSGTFSGDIALGEVWCAIPDLLPPYVAQLSGLDDAWLRPRVAFDADWMLNDPDWESLDVQLRLLVAGLPPGSSSEELDEILRRFPAMEGGGLQTHPGLDAPLTGWSPDGQDCVTIIYPKLSRAEIDKAAPLHSGTGARLLLPSVRRGDNLSPLMLWWVLLFGLSIVARYDPETWVATLAVNDTQDAVALDTALDLALEAVPLLLTHALAP